MNETKETPSSSIVDESKIKQPPVMWIALIVATIGASFMLMVILDRDKQVDALMAAGQKSPIHQFVVDKYLGCRSEVLGPSREECVARVMVLARVQGDEYETKAGAAIRDLGLDK